MGSGRSASAGGPGGTGASGLFRRKRLVSPPATTEGLSFHPLTANLPRPSLSTDVLCGKGLLPKTEGFA